MTEAEVARRLGWILYNRPNAGDGSRVRRYLGLRPESGSRQLRRASRYNTAVALIEAMGFDPIDFDL
jgi:hypothetical protein